MKKSIVFLICIIIIGCSATEHVDLSNQHLYGYQPNDTLRKERLASIVQEQKIGQNTLLKYEDGISFLVAPDGSILSIEASSEMAPTDSRNGIKRGDSIDKVVQRLGKSFSTRREQGAKIYTYQDTKHNLTLEYWSTADKVQTIRLMTAGGGI